MLRITKFRPTRALEPAEGLKALEVAQEAAEALNKVQGVTRVKLYLGGGGLVFAGEAADYASADRLLTDPGCQQAIGRLATEFGYNVESNEFLLEPVQVYPFLKA